jgi:hypothetical protein
MLFRSNSRLVGELNEIYNHSICKAQNFFDVKEGDDYSKYFISKSYQRVWKLCRLITERRAYLRLEEFPLAALT